MLRCRSTTPRESDPAVSHVRRLVLDVLKPHRRPCSTWPTSWATSRAWPASTSRSSRSTTRSRTSRSPSRATTSTTRRCRGHPGLRRQHPLDRQGLDRPSAHRRGRDPPGCRRPLDAVTAAVYLAMSPKTAPGPPPGCAAGSKTLRHYHQRRRGRRDRPPLLRHERLRRRADDARRAGRRLIGGRRLGAPVIAVVSAPRSA